MEKPYAKAGQILKQARLKKELNQSDIAEKLDTTAPHYSRWETGQHKPSSDSLRKLCEILKLNYEELQRTYKKSKYQGYITREGKNSVVSDKDSDIIETLEGTARALSGLDLDEAVKIGLLESLQKRIEQAIEKLREANNGN